VTGANHAAANPIGAKASRVPSRISTVDSQQAALQRARKAEVGTETAGLTPMKRCVAWGTVNKALKGPAQCVREPR